MRLRLGSHVTRWIPSDSIRQTWSCLNLHSYRTACATTVVLYLSGLLQTLNNDPAPSSSKRNAGTTCGAFCDATKSHAPQQTPKKPGTMPKAQSNTLRRSPTQRYSYDAEKHSTQLNRSSRAILGARILCVSTPNLSPPEPNESVAKVPPCQSHYPPPVQDLKSFLGESANRMSRLLRYTQDASPVSRPIAPLAPSPFANDCAPGRR